MKAYATGAEGKEVMVARQSLSSVRCRSLDPDGLELGSKRTTLRRAARFVQEAELYENWGQLAFEARKERYILRVSTDETSELAERSSIESKVGLV